MPAKRSTSDAGACTPELSTTRSRFAARRWASTSALH